MANTYNKSTSVNTSRTNVPLHMKNAARRADLIAYLNEKHPGSIFFGPHKDHPEFISWRSAKHDSLAFFDSDDEQGYSITKYCWWKLAEEIENGTSSAVSAVDDAISYLMKFENYSYANAVYCLATFASSDCKDSNQAQELVVPMADSERERLKAYDALGLNPASIRELLEAACWFRFEEYDMTLSIIKEAFSRFDPQ